MVGVEGVGWLSERVHDRLVQPLELGCLDRRLRFGDELAVSLLVEAGGANALGEVPLVGRGVGAGQWPRSRPAGFAVHERAGHDRDGHEAMPVRGVRRGDVGAAGGPFAVEVEVGDVVVADPDLVDVEADGQRSGGVSAFVAA